VGVWSLGLCFGSVGLAAQISSDDRQLDEASRLFEPEVSTLLGGLAISALLSMLLRMAPEVNAARRYPVHPVRAAGV